MTDDDRSSPARRRHLRWAVAATTGLLCVCAGFAAGRVTAPSTASSPTDACQEAQDAMQDALDEAETYPEGSDDARTHTLVGAHVIAQNPDCFGPGLRATVRTRLDQNQSP